MPLAAFLREPDNWLNRLGDPATHFQVNAFMVGIGATKLVRTQHDIQTDAPQVTHTYVNNWYVPNYAGKSFRPLLSLADEERLLPRRTKFGSLHQLIQDEYNPVLGIDHRSTNFLEDLAWLGDYAAALVRLGYAEADAAEILYLLRVEGDYGRIEGPVFVTGGSPRIRARPAQVLLDNIEYASLLVRAKHLSADYRRRYTRLAIPVADLPALLRPGVPYDYAHALYPRRKPYVPTAA